VTGRWRKLYNEELYNLQSSPSIIRIVKSRKMELAGHSTTGENRNVCRLLVGNPEEKRPLGRTRRRWLDDIKMDVGERECGGVDWIELPACV
jgi:hypothetical protein